MNEKELEFDTDVDFQKEFKKIAFLEGARSYDIGTMSDLANSLKHNNYEILEVFDLYNNPNELKKVILFNPDTLIMGTTGLREDTAHLVKKGLKLAKENGFNPANIIDVNNNNYFEFVAEIFKCNYYSGLEIFCDEINLMDHCNYGEK